MAKDKVKDSVTGGQLEPLTMTQAELDAMIEKAKTEAVTEYRKGSHKHNNPDHIITTQDISKREKAYDEKRGNKALPDDKGKESTSE